MNALWTASAAPDYARFVGRVRGARTVQDGIVLQIVRANRDTAFGRAHGFENIRSPEDYRRCVPIRTYEAMSSWIDRVEAGEVNILTRESVLRFEPTGGSTSGSKLIPYTRRLAADARRATHRPTNARTPYRLAVYLASNWVSRREITRKQGRPLGARRAPLPVAVQRA